MQEMLDEPTPEFRLGDTVWVTPLQSEGEIIELTPTDVEISIGRLRVRAKMDEIQKRSNTESKAEKQKARNMERNDRDLSMARGMSPGLELDLRGTTVEDAVDRVDNYLDAAYIAGLPFVRIIHGKGTGALRKAIRDSLHRHPLVRHYERGE